MKHVQLDDGIFFISWEGFLKHFDFITVCYYFDHYKYSALRLKSEEQELTFVQFNVTEPGDYYISLVQQNDRRYDKYLYYTYSILSFLVSKQVGERKYEYVGFAEKQDREIWTK